MKTARALLILAASLAGPASQAQQSPNPQPPQPPQTQAQPAPCGVKPPAPKPPGAFHFKLPPKLQQAIDKQRQGIANKTGVTLPSTADVTKQTQQPVKPCPAPQPAPSAPVPAPPAQGNSQQ